MARTAFPCQKEIVQNWWNQRNKAKKREKRLKEEDEEEEKQKDAEETLGMASGRLQRQLCL